MKSKIKAQHTPTPWKALNRFVLPMNEGVSIAQCTILKGTTEDNDIKNEIIACNNAAFIVRAVNSHEELLNVMKEFVEDIEATTIDDIKDDWPDIFVTYQKAKAAIAKAEEKI